MKDRQTSSACGRADTRVQHGIARTQAPTAEAAGKALRDLVKTHGRIVELPSGDRADLADREGCEAYLLSLDLQFRSPIERLRNALHGAVYDLTPAQHIDSTNYEAILSYTAAVHDLDRALAHELVRAQALIERLENWLFEVSQRSDMVKILRRSGHEAPMVLLMLAHASLTEINIDRSDRRVAQLVRAGCQMPPDVAQQFANTPLHGFRELCKGVESWLARSGRGAPDAS